MQSDCIFCKIARKEIPAEIVYEDENAVAFKDINPVAPVHVLVIPKKHIASLNEADPIEDVHLLGHLLLVAKRVADLLGISESGYRIVINTGPDAGQAVFHLHVHVIGGRQMQWPPG